MEEIVLENKTAMEGQGLGERLLRELIKSPKFKTSLKILANELDPSTARGTVRAIMWEDVETFMGEVSLLPTLLNYSVEAAHELAVQLNAFPPAILVAFLSQLAEQVDFKAMEDAIEEFKTLLEKLNPVIERLRDASPVSIARVTAAE
jgi:hypothetical protein